MELSSVFPVSYFLLPEEARHALRNEPAAADPAAYPSVLLGFGAKFSLPPWLADLARIEYAVFLVGQGPRSDPAVERLMVSPSLQLLRCDWKNLPSLLCREAEPPPDLPVVGEDFVLVYRGPVSGKVLVRPARDHDLLALKIVADELDRAQAAAAAGVKVGVIDRCLEKAVLQGILAAPPSRIVRDPCSFPRGLDIDERFFTAPVFTLQWHITQTCDLHCRHCYDRSDRAPMPLADGLRILDDFREFCLAHHVKGQISFSGGNPLLYPHFFELYRGAVERNMMVAILGNPASPALIDKIAAVAVPVFYQVSLEGLPEHNDYIRGAGHFDRVMRFLPLLRDHGVYSMVMLTLTRANMGQVLPLAEVLRDKVDLFTFNRLAMVGEGARLQSADPADFQIFLHHYHAAARENSTISLKDNLLNIIRHEHGLPLFGGCAGHGCGAAFNFISVLPDGEAHACRKFPSPIGNVLEHGITEVYYGTRAARYRAGTDACASCVIRPVCGGCFAVVHGLGLDPFTDRDPYCFMELEAGTLVGCSGPG